jgi:hypothetical protein
VVLAPEHSHHAHNNSGNFYPVIASDGVICGNWSPHQSTLHTAMFDPGTNINLENDWQQYRNQKIKW